MIEMLQKKLRDYPIMSSAPAMKSSPIANFATTFKTEPRKLQEAAGSTAARPPILTLRSVSRR